MPKVPTVLVTGGAGFIGSHLVRRLATERLGVRVFDNFSSGAAANLVGLRGVDVVTGDVRSKADVARAMGGIDSVFHLAAISSVEQSWKDPVGSLATNTHGTANVIEAAIAAGASSFIYSSSAAIYGELSGKAYEDLEPKPISPYGYSKLLAEKLVLAYGRNSSDIRAVALRYFNVFGPRQDPASPYAAVIPLFIQHAIAGTTATIYGDGRQTRDFTYVDDVVDANLRALRSDVTGVAMNISLGKGESLLELVDAISVLSSRPLKAVFAAQRAGEIRHSLGDISLAASTIGYQPKVSLRDGLAMVLSSG